MKENDQSIISTLTMVIKTAYGKREEGENMAIFSAKDILSHVHESGGLMDIESILSALVQQLQEIPLYDKYNQTKQIGYALVPVFEIVSKIDENLFFRPSETDHPLYVDVIECEEELMACTPCQTKGLN